MVRALGSTVASMVLVALVVIEFEHLATWKEAMGHSLNQAWERTLVRGGSDCAVVQANDGASATFRELDTLASEWLRAHAPQPQRLKGRAVVFSAPNGIAWLKMFLGLLKAGSIVVPLDAAEPLPSQRASRSRSGRGSGGRARGSRRWQAQCAAATPRHA